MGGGAGQRFVRREAEVGGGEARRREAGCRGGGVEGREVGRRGRDRTARGEGGAKRQADARACIIADFRACRRGRTGVASHFSHVVRGYAEPRHCPLSGRPHAPLPPLLPHHPPLPPPLGWLRTNSLATVSLYPPGALGPLSTPPPPPSTSQCAPLLASAFGLAGWLVSGPGPSHTHRSPSSPPPSRSRLARLWCTAALSHPPLHAPLSLSTEVSPSAQLVM